MYGSVIKKFFILIRTTSCELESHSWQGVLDTTLCDEDCQCLATGQWFSPGISVSYTNKTDHHDIAEILLKVTLNTTSDLSIFFFIEKSQYFTP